MFTAITKQIINGRLCIQRNRLTRMYTAADQVAKLAKMNDEEG